MVNLTPVFAKAPRAPRAKSVKIGAAVEVFGRKGVVTAKCNRFKSAFIVAFDGVDAPASFSRDMIKAI